MKNFTSKYCLSVLVAWLLATLLPSGTSIAAVRHFVTNFSQGDVRKGAQTWEIASYDGTWTYFANKFGLLQHDGSRWKLLPVANNLDLRSVHVSHSSGRIYVGGIDEFGYFAPDEQGTMRYTSIRTELSEYTNIDNIWKICEDGDLLYVQADSKIFTILGGSVIRMIATDVKMRCSNLVNGILYVGAEDGLYMLVGERLIRAVGCDAVAGMRIVGIEPYGVNTIVATAHNGLYVYDGNSIKPLVTGHEDFLTDDEVFTIALQDQILAIGTVLNGVLVVDLATKVAEHFDESNGLQNNTVLSLAFDPQGNLWAGLDSGIDYIWLSLPLHRLTTEKSIGAGYAVSYYDGKLYLGTNRGLYMTPFAPEDTFLPLDLSVVPLLSGQVWDLQVVDGDLFCMSDHGLFLVEGKRLTRIGEFSGAWTVQKIDDGSGRVYVGVYNGVNVIKKIGGKWTDLAHIANLNMSVYNFQQRGPNEIWVRDQTKGVVRFNIDLDNYTVVKQAFYGVEEGLPSPVDNYVNIVDGRLSFSTGEGFYLYDEYLDRIVPDTMMNRHFGGPDECTRAFQYGDYTFAISGKVCLTYDSRNATMGSLRMLSTKVEPIIGGWERIEAISDTLFILPNYYGYAVFNASGILNTKARRQANYAEICYMSLPNAGDSVVYERNYLNTRPVPKVPHSSNSVKFSFGVSHIETEGLFRYECRLRNHENWTENSSGIKEYTNLTEGDYTFEVKAYCADGEVYSDSFDFQVLPPWYHTVWAFMGYAVILACLVVIFLRIENRRVERKKAVVVREKDEQMLERQTEFEQKTESQHRQIVELEKEKLQSELIHKSQELANLLMNFAHKNEVLIDIKEKLQKIATKLPPHSDSNTTEARQMLVALKGTIDTGIKSDNLFKRIEDEFDIIHNGFIKKLKTAYPDLSNNELLMCAYVRMNMSSKEISTLLNMSVRGVETMRYRIRRKFNLDRESSLNEFFNYIEASSDNEQQ